MRRVMFCANAQADLNIRLAHGSDGTFSDVATFMIIIIVIIRLLTVYIRISPYIGSDTLTPNII